MKRTSLTLCACLAFASLFTGTAPVTASETPPVPEADGLVALDAHISTFSCLLDGNISVDAHIIAGPTKNHLLPTLEPGQAVVELDDGGQVQPLFGPNGKANAAALQGNSARILLPVADILASPALHAQLIQALGALEEQKGKEFGQPWIDRTLEVALILQDPLARNTAKTIGTCELRRIEKQVEHALHFTIENDDLRALRSAAQEELSIEVRIRVNCRVSQDLLRAEAGVISSAVVALANDVKSLSGNEIEFVAASGGKLNSKDALQSFFRHSVVLTIGMRDGESVPPAFVEAVLYPTLSHAFDMVELQNEDQKRVVGMIIDNQLLVWAPIGEIRGVLESTRKQLETHGIDSISTANKTSEKRGSTLFGLVPDTSSMTESQRAELTDRLRQELNEATKKFDGALPAITAMDVRHTSKLSTGDVEAIAIALSRFSVRWVELTIQSSLVTFHERSSHLQALLQAREILRAQIAAECKTIESDMQRLEKLQALNLAQIQSSIDAALASRGVVTTFEAFQAWCVHEEKTGRAGAVQAYDVYMSSDGRKPMYAHNKATLAAAQQALKSLCERLRSLQTPRPVSDDAPHKSAAQLTAEITELARLDREIETLLRLGTR